jgi:hypothetical protein
MRINILFTVLTIMVIIIVVVMSDSIWAAIAFTALALNFLVLSGKLSKRGYMSANMVNWGAPADADIQPADADIQPTDANIQPTQQQPTQQQPTISSYPGVIERNNIVSQDKLSDDDQNTNLYGQEQAEYDNYINAYTNCYDKSQHVVGFSCAEGDSTMDTAGALMAQKRTRDKKCMDGFVSKMSNPHFMRHHYSKELDEEESKVWWARGEY